MLTAVFSDVHGNLEALDAALRDARSHGAELAFYGHTHFPEIDRSHPLVTAANPGSLTFPRQDGRKPSYLIAELEEGRKPELFLHFLKRERGLFW